MGAALWNAGGIGSRFRGEPDAVGNFVTLVLGVPLGCRGSCRGLDPADSDGVEISERQKSVKREPEPIL